jgi:hypothetical protein
LRIWGIIAIIAALGQFVLAYFAAIDRIKPSKSTLILYYILAGMLLLNLSLGFLR